MSNNHEENLDVEKHPNRGNRGWLGEENGTENVELEKSPNRGSRGWLGATVLIIIEAHFVFPFLFVCEASQMQLDQASLHSE